MKLNNKKIKKLNDKRNKQAALEHAFKMSNDKAFKNLMVKRMVALNLGANVA